METMTPEMWTSILQVGGAPVAIMIAAGYFFRGQNTTIEKLEVKLDRMNDTINQIDRRLLTMEVEARAAAAPD
jgi:hypothetical protein